MKHIHFISRSEIDDARWDQCIDQSPDGLIYAKSFFLDAITDQWDGLVMGDYEIVMPLVWRKKWGIYYIFQPFFAAQLGPSGKLSTPGYLSLFLKAIPSKFKWIEMDLNESVDPAEAVTLATGDYALSRRINYLIPPGTYENMRNQYHRLARRMLRKSFLQNILIQSVKDPSAVIQFYQEQYHQKQPGIRPGDYRLLNRTAMMLKQMHQCHCYSATWGKEKLGAYLLFSDQRFFYSVLGGSSERGRQLGAFYALTDFAIQEALKNGKQFRFEGSDKEGIAAFNAQFGAKPIPYLHIKCNRLPWPLRLLKK